MRDKELLKEILTRTREHWDHPETRPSVRENFKKMIHCRTPILGAEVFASEKEEKIVYHTCKSRSCPSCGHRGTLLWQTDQWAALPDIPYAGVVFTMPDVLWPIFRQNRHLLHDVSVLGAQAIQQWMKAKYGVRVLIIVVQHTFGRGLNFHPHLHILVSAGGLQESESRWIERLHFDKNELMEMWRYAITIYLWEARRANVLTSDLASQDFNAALKTQYGRRWNIYIARFQSKSQFLRYAGRYIRRPPIAEHRFVRITDREVQFRTKKLKEKRIEITRYPVEEFVALLAEHVLDHYRHAIRYFGLLAPRSKALTSGALFAILGQQKRPRPDRLSWRSSLRKYFGTDPLLDSTGKAMRWVGRLSPSAT